MKKIYFALCLIVISCNFGCFQQATKNQAKIAEAPSFETISERALSSSFFEKGSFCEGKWWLLFADPQLSALIEEALKSNPTLKAAEAKVVAAQAAAKMIRSNLFPNLGADATDNWQYLSKYGFDRSFFPIPDPSTIPAKYNEVDLSLNFSYEIDFFGKNRKKLREALGLAVAQEMERAEASLILCTSIAFAYFEWQTHFAEKQLYEKWLSTEKQLEHFFSLRSKKGLDNSIGYLTQKQATDALYQKVIDKEKELEIDLLFLKNLLGEGPDYFLALTPHQELLSQKIPLPPHLEIDLLAQRPDLMAQIWRVEAAAEAIGVAKTEFYPNVNLLALGGLSSLTLSKIFNWASRTGTLLPAIHLPIFTGGQLSANLSSKVALFNEAVETYNSLLLKAVQEVGSEITTFLSIQKEVTLQQSIVETQQKNCHLASLRYQKGIDDYSHLLKANLTTFSKEFEALEWKHSSLLSCVRLIKSLGGGMPLQKLPSIYPTPSS
jgi:NodT family efflux transporter outer membrane factor (OMF) lipoprotein